MHATSVIYPVKQSLYYVYQTSWRYLMKRLLHRIKKIKARYPILVLIGMIVYLCAEIYIMNSPKPNDNEIPNLVKDSVLMLIYADNTDDQNDVFNLGSDK